jgi:hypothetical protein
MTHNHFNLLVWYRHRFEAVNGQMLSAALLAFSIGTTVRRHAVFLIQTTDPYVTDTPYPSLSYI